MTKKKPFPKKIVGKRVNLRELRASDAKNLYTYLQDPLVTRWTLRIPYPYHKKDATDFIKRAQKSYRSGDSLIYGITRTGSDEVIGIASFQIIEWNDKHSEIAYWRVRP